MIQKLTEELIDGKKTYSVSGFALFSNTFSRINLPMTIPECTEVFNLVAAIGAAVLVLWRIVGKLRKKKSK